jgi:hypothetical protein
VDTDFAIDARAVHPNKTETPRRDEAFRGPVVKLGGQFVRKATVGFIREARNAGM